jgi:hypothetical protein
MADTAATTSGATAPLTNPVVALSALQACVATTEAEA